jgi:GT2 family glycosyltransferase
MLNKKTLDLSIIIPFKNHAELTIACLNSIIEYADPIKEILLVSNNSSDKELEKVSAVAKGYPNTKVLVYNHPFNFQSINNWAVKQSTGTALLLLNNDVELVMQSRTLLRAMFKKALEPTIGAVGAVLLYEDVKTIQHAGVYLVPGGTADHLYIGMNLDKVKKRIGSGEYIYDITHDLRVSAVTAAAVMVSREKFNSITGFNEAFIICGGDVDLCLRLEETNKQSVLIGSDQGYMIHKESRSRSSIGIPYTDFIESYKSYINHFNTVDGDVYLHSRKVPHE